jgi:putative MATE family efflux protein
VLALGVVLALVGSFGAGALLSDVIGAKGQVVARGTDYLAVVMGGSVTMFLVLHFASLLRAVGSGKTPVTFLVLGNVLNFVLAVLFVFGTGDAPAALGWGRELARALGIPRLELLGAGVATLLSRAAILLPLGLYCAKRLGFVSGRTPLVPSREILAEVGRLAWPSSAELCVRMSAMLLTHSLVARAFTTATDQSATTALGVVFRFETMALFVSIGWGSAVQTFVGQNLGAAQPERAKRSGYWAALYNALMMAVLSWLYIEGSAEIVGFFAHDPKVLFIAESYFSWVAPSYVALGVGIVLGSVMQGAGTPLRALLIDLCVVLLFQAPVTLLIGFLPSRTLEQAWLSVALGYVLLAVLFFGSYRRGRFLRAALA